MRRSNCKLFRSNCKLAARLLACTVGLLAFTGCNGFFVYPGTATGSTTTTTTDYAYVANGISGSTYINGYSIGSGALTPVSSSPFNLGFSPVAMAINPANGLLFVASTSPGGIGSVYGYAIHTGGALQILGGGNALLNEAVAAMDISPDGQWLFLLDNNATTITQYSINSTTGVLTTAASYNLSSATSGIITPSAIKVAPTGTFFVAALGTGGFNTFNFNTTTGVGSPNSLESPGSAASGYYGITVDANNYIYASGTAGLQVFSTNAGVPTFLSTYATGNGARSVVVNKASTFAFVANTSDGTISSYAIGASGVLTAVPGSPTTGPTSVAALATDGTGAYLLTTGYNTTNGTQLFNYASTGLTSKASAATAASTTVATAVALTH